MSEAQPFILILCTGNSCRSHMAEGILRAACKGQFQVASAGSKPAGHVHPLAFKVLAEIGIDPAMIAGLCAENILLVPP